MEVLLVNPPYSEFVYESRRKAASLDAPLSIAYIAAVLEREGFSVKIIDANALNLTIGKTAERISNSSADIIGISSTTTVMPVTYKLSDEIKKRCDKKVLVGGPHVTFTDKQTLKECKSIDMVVRGEGEMTMLDLVQKAGNPKSVKGITYRERSKIITNPRREFIENLDSLPFPARHLLPIRLYRSGSPISTGAEGTDYASMITTRGCPNRCVYCSSSHFWGIKVRFRAPENVVKEIEQLVENYGTKEIFFKDDTFTFSPIRTQQICDLMIERDLDIKWCCYARVNTITRKLLVKMKKAGCFGLDLGIESGNQKILNRINKNITLEQARKVLKMAKEEGLSAYTSFMFGLPGDNLKTSNETIDFAIELNPDVAQFFITTPFPGTELYKEAIQKGWIYEVENWKDFDISSSTKYRNDELTNKEIRILLSRAYKRFYSRPGFWLHSLKRLVRNPRQLKNYFYGGLAVIDLI